MDFEGGLREINNGFEAWKKHIASNEVKHKMKRALPSNKKIKEDEAGGAENAAATDGLKAMMGLGATTVSTDAVGAADGLKSMLGMPPTANKNNNSNP